MPCPFDYRQWRAGVGGEALRDRQLDIGVVRAPHQLTVCGQFGNIARPVMFEAQPLGRAIEAEDRAALVLIHPLRRLFGGDVGGHPLPRQPLGERRRPTDRHEDFAEDRRVPDARDAVTAIIRVDHRIGHCPTAEEVGA